MAELELSVMIHTAQTEVVLTNLLQEFKVRSGIQVNLRLLQWETAHAELNKIALYHHGPDISEIGTTWVGDLIAMNALRPFAPNEINQIGRPEEFVETSWKSGQQAGDPTQWAVPWLAETHVIHYRRDLLRNAGIDEKTAFSSHANLAETVRLLSENGVAVPIELPLNLDMFDMLHVLASWIWTAGGDFVDSTGRKVIINQPETLAAIRQFINLIHQLPTDARRAVRDRQQFLFTQGKSAINFGTLMFYSNRKAAPEALRENWVVAPLPGQHFLGGSNLVMWKHTRSDRQALELLRYLTSSSVQARLALPLAALPPRLDALNAPQIIEDQALSVFAESVRTGRSYPSVPLWGLIEDRLISVLQAISLQVGADGDIDLDAYIQQQIEAVTRRLNLTLEK